MRIIFIVYFKFFIFLCDFKIFLKIYFFIFFWFDKKGEIFWVRLVENLLLEKIFIVMLVLFLIKGLIKFLIFLILRFIRFVLSINIILFCVFLIL